MDTNAGIQTTRSARERCWQSHAPLLSPQTDTSPLLLGYTQEFKNLCKSLQPTDSAKEMGELPRDPPGRLCSVIPCFRLHCWRGGLGFMVGLVDTCLTAQWSFWGHVSRV